MADIQNEKVTNADLSAELVRDLIKERRRDRRWRNLRFFAGFLVVILIIWGLFAGSKSDSDLDGAGAGYIALIRLDGMIAPGTNFSAEEVVPRLRDAFSDKRAKGVILDINSPGGTPVQASIIHDEIVKLKNKYKKKVVIVGEDMLTSGAYFIAVAGDKIYVNPNTVTGSIGVIMQGFGFPELMKRVGIERRVYKAGNNKDRIDPFLPESPADIAKITSVVDEVHTNFSDVVLKGRQGKLQGDTKELFSGDFWTGQTAVKLGLVDGVGDLWDVMQNEFQVTRYKNYSGMGGIFKALASQVGSTFNLPVQSTALRLWEKM